MDEPTDITGLLAAHRRGDPDALDVAFERIYGQLRRMAANRLRGQAGSLQTTGLVHEAYLKLVGPTSGDWQDRKHFLAVASRAMRQILVDRARARMSRKRGGDVPRVALDSALDGTQAKVEEIVAIGEALTRLETLDPRLSRVVELRFFGGLSVEETAAVLEVGERTVKRDWRKARALLRRILAEDPEC